VDLGEAAVCAVCRADDCVFGEKGPVSDALSGESSASCQTRFESEGPIDGCCSDVATIRRANDQIAGLLNKIRVKYNSHRAEDDLFQVLQGQFGQGMLFLVSGKDVHE
jgi:hypothetical protein